MKFFKSTRSIVTHGTQLPRTVLPQSCTVFFFDIGGRKVPHDTISVPRGTVCVPHDTV